MYSSFIYLSCLELIPYLLSIFFIFYCYLKSYYSKLFTVNNFFKLHESYISSQKKTFSFFIQFNLKYLLLYNVLFSNLTADNLFVINSSKHLVVVYLIFTILLLTFLKVEKLDWVFFIYILTLNNIFIIITSNILNLFFLIELNSYIFVVLLVMQSWGNKSNNNNNNNTALVFFSLNFFCSIFLFLSVYYLMYVYGTIFINFFVKDSHINTFILFLMFKCSAGPWLVFNVEVYKGTSLLNIVFYTLSFFLVLLPKIFSFIIFFSSFFKPIVFLLSLALYFNFLFSNVSVINSFKVFVAYSSSVFLSQVLVVVFLFLFF